MIILSHLLWFVFANFSQLRRRRRNSNFNYKETKLQTSSNVGHQMEALYLLSSIISTSLTSFALSLLLLFRRLFPSRAAGAPDSVSLYQGTVWHERRRPVHHSFKYSVKYALIDLDHALHAPSDHLSPDEARRVAETNGPV